MQGFVDQARATCFERLPDIMPVEEDTASAG